MKNRQTNWGAIIAAFLTIVSILFGFYPSLSSYSYIAFLLALVTYLYDQDQRFSKRLKKTDENSNQMANDVKKHLQVIRLDKTAKTWDEYVIKRLDQIKSIKNTSFNLPEDHTDADDKFNESEELEKAPELVKKAIEKGLKWRDIGDDLATKRFLKWNEICSNTVVQNTGYYKYSILNSNRNVPYPNFMIITYRDDLEEVLFNWDHRKALNPTVLASREEELVRFYNAQFALLLDASSNFIDDSN
ncbi:hypothetical protein LL14B4_10475 [Lactococcus lactis subsp. lactis]|uniref:Uncharacterized protein n=1 Tax=Lactococcus lactis subsp. lactis TaxID=1360 RepID=A0A2Z3KGF2_LACLL|nr:hypothetical protein [Lactococcus lactis]AWN66577.1 hypothetical protein LL14B4_10475 [Lactococcus lactis subsp. lactis]